ncbi:hypothetical protein [Agromyces sp. CF514]|uniref:hypothetical protein n=1 Tax=Agromyces sp. CF514 TaxID=1881031 RepID=UPI0011606434|nr:hypothetical protein [Agromyces sp. CF514]
MKLTAIGDSGADLPDGARSAYHSHEMTRYRLVVGRTYSPFAMALIRQMGLKVLILDESGRPNWLPLPLFAVNGHSLPDSWLFAVTEVLNAPAVAAIWGYRDLVMDPAHFEALIERKLEAWEAFLDAADGRSDLEPHERDAVSVARAEVEKSRQSHHDSRP